MQNPSEPSSTGTRRTLPRVPVPPDAGVSCDASFYARPPFACKKMLPVDLGPGGIALRIGLTEGSIHEDLLVKLRIHTPSGEIELDGVVRGIKGSLRRRVAIRFERNSNYMRFENTLTRLVNRYLPPPTAPSTRH